jgi:hypothetical protein
MSYKNYYRYRKMMANGGPTDPPTKIDSINVRNSSLGFEKAIKNLGYEKDPSNHTRSIDIDRSSRSLDDYLSYDDGKIIPNYYLWKTNKKETPKGYTSYHLPPNTYKMGSAARRDKDRKIGEGYKYLEQISPTKYIASELLSPDGYNTDLPTFELDSRIKPQGVRDYFETNDIVKFPYYDPLAVTPWQDLTPEEQVERRDKYGDTGTPYDSAISKRSASSLRRAAARNTLTQEMKAAGFTGYSAREVLKPGSDAAKAWGAFQNKEPNPPEFTNNIEIAPENKPIVQENLTPIVDRPVYPKSAPEGYSLVKGWTGGDGVSYGDYYTYSAGAKDLDKYPEIPAGPPKKQYGGPTDPPLIPKPTYEDSLYLYQNSLPEKFYSQFPKGPNAEKDWLNKQYGLLSRERAESLIRSTSDDGAPPDYFDGVFWSPFIDDKVSYDAPEIIQKYNPPPENDKLANDNWRSGANFKLPYFETVEGAPIKPIGYDVVGRSQWIEGDTKTHWQEDENGFYIPGSRYEVKEPGRWGTEGEYGTWIAKARYPKPTGKPTKSASSLARQAKRDALTQEMKDAGFTGYKAREVLNPGSEAAKAWEVFQNAYSHEPLKLSEKDANQEFHTDEEGTWENLEDIWNFRRVEKPATENDASDNYNPKIDGPFPKYPKSAPEGYTLIKGYKAGDGKWYGNKYVNAEKDEIPAGPTREEGALMGVSGLSNFLPKKQYGGPIETPWFMPDVYANGGGAVDGDPPLTWKNNKDYIQGIGDWGIASDVPITNRQSDDIKRKLRTGKYGYDPSTGTLNILNENDWGTISAEDAPYVNQAIAHANRTPEEQQAFEKAKQENEYKKFKSGKQRVKIDQFTEGFKGKKIGDVAHLTDEEYNNYLTQWDKNSYDQISKGMLWNTPGMVATAGLLPNVGVLPGVIPGVAAGANEFYQGNPGRGSLYTGLSLLPGIPPAYQGIKKGAGKARQHFVQNLVNTDPNIHSMGMNPVKKLPLEKSFKSEIDWAKWNKEIPDNKPLMKEYNAIEQSTKADGTWMKNPDGSKFSGTPEQFVQQNSKNFKKAFPNILKDSPTSPINILTHHSPNKFNAFDEAKKLSGVGQAKYGEGIYTVPKTYYDDFMTQDFKEMAMGKKPVYVGYGKNRYDLYANDIGVKQFPVRKPVGINTHPLPAYKTRPNTAVVPYNNQLKSATGNNGMFDMSNPNIYKSLAPIMGAGALGAGLSEKALGGSTIMAHGGSPQYEAEGGEVIQGKNPQVYNGGNLKQISEDSFKIEGNSHENGGVAMSGGDYVYSDRIALDNNILSQLDL